LYQVLIKIEPNQRYLPVYSNCQKKVRLIHSYNVRLVRDIPIMQAKTVLKVCYRNVGLLYLRIYIIESGKKTCSET